jgi:hypothetical protein
MIEQAPPAPRDPARIGTSIRLIERNFGLIHRVAKRYYAPAR